MKKIYLTFGIMASGLILLSACGKKEAPPEETAAPAAEPAPREVRGVPPPPVSPAAQPTTRPAATSDELLDSPFRVGAIIDRGEGQLLAGLIAHDEDVHNMVRVGEDFRGYIVTRIDPDATEVFLERAGRNYVARMSPGRMVPPSPTEPMAAQIPTLTAPVEIGDVSAFEPTEDEIRRGINPNDPSTWPADYRGPGIERAGLPSQIFEASEDEARRGINPNDPETWPTGYRGPGIERALQEMQQQNRVE